MNVNYIESLHFKQDPNTPIGVLLNLLTNAVKKKVALIFSPVFLGYSLMTKLKISYVLKKIIIITANAITK